MIDRLSRRKNASRLAQLANCPDASNAMPILLTVFHELFLSFLLSLTQTIIVIRGSSSRHYLSRKRNTRSMQSKTSSRILRLDTQLVKTTQFISRKSIPFPNSFSKPSLVSFAANQLYESSSNVCNPREHRTSVDNSLEYFFQRKNRDRVYRNSYSTKYRSRCEK